MSTRLRYACRVKWLLPLAGLLILTACSQPKTKDPADLPAFRALGEKVVVDETRSDESIGFDVRQHIDLAGPSELAGVIIQVEDGIVTLTGSAPNLQASWRAEGAARAVLGVKKVINRILLTTPGQK